MVHRALMLAAQAHHGQSREGEMPLPYLTHPVEVMVNLRWVGGVTDQEMLCAAALHDVLEETSVTFGQLEREFGERVASLVRQVTRSEPTSEQIEGLDKDEVVELRSAMLLAEIAKMGPDAMTLKLADRLSNLREAKLTRGKKRLERYLAQTGAILEIIPRKVNPSLWDAIKAEL